MVTTPTGKDIRLLETGALKALAHPMRVEIYDIITQYGAQTASSLAERLGESTGATSYHLRALAKHDLIREAAGRGAGRERWWERPEGRVSFFNPEAMVTPAGRAATHLVTTEFLNLRHRQLLEYVTVGLEGEPKDWAECGLVSTASVRLSLEQLTELSAAVQSLIDETVDKYRDQQGEGLRPVTIRADIFPLLEGTSS